MSGRKFLSCISGIPSEPGNGTLSEIEKAIQQCDREIERIRSTDPPDQRAYLAVLGTSDWEFEKRILESMKRELMTDEERMAEWVKTRIGPGHMNPRERAMRLLEEAVELAQAEGITEAQAIAQVGYVFTRPVGNPEQEAAGVAVCLLGWCAAAGKRLHPLALAELERIEAKPLDQIRGSLKRKSDRDLITTEGEE